MVAQIISWIKLHWVEIIGVYTGIVTVASIVVRLTPTQSDDAVLQKIIDFISKFVALNKVEKK